MHPFAQNKGRCPDESGGHQDPAYWNADGETMAYRICMNCSFSHQPPAATTHKPASCAMSHPLHA